MNLIFSTSLFSGEHLHIWYTSSELPVHHSAPLPVPARPQPEAVGEDPGSAVSLRRQKGYWQVEQWQEDGSWLHLEVL